MFHKYVRRAGIITAIVLFIIAFLTAVSLA